MDPIEFADGFDRPDRIAFGLSGGQLAVVMVGALAALLTHALAAAGGDGASRTRPRTRLRSA